MDEICYKVAASTAEIQGHFAVRRAVFVEEQGLFAGSDVDEHDAHALALVALHTGNGAVVGAVRCYTTGNDVWYGGRLAVLPSYRREAAAIGANLCRLAEATVIAHGCQLFLAYIQTQNVRFFQRLGWQPVGAPEPHYGKPHQLMAAGLAAASLRRDPLEALGALAGG